ncbi:signal recognition particle protein [Clostridium sp. CAG:568]|nr:signal recognition particle protein [Clostridium sp. CAG:568]
MAFENLTDKLSGIFKKLKGQATLTEKNMDDAFKEVRIALLDADVNYDVVNQFMDEVKSEAIGQKVLTKLSPGQQLIKIVHDKLEALLGGGDNDVTFNSGKPTVIMMVGLQGTGKTTTAGKLANLYKTKMKKKVLLCADDTQRPAAIDQLKTLADSIEVDCYIDRIGTKPPLIAKAAFDKARNEKYDVLIIDTAGRLQIDEPLMDELKEIQKIIPVDETLLLVDAMSGQDAVNVATTFNKEIPLTGLVMSKLDGDARGGAALSIRKMTGVPIKYAGVGEKIEDLENFHPDRMADRILGMGDVLTLIEDIQAKIDEKQTEKTSRRLMNGQFDLNDLLSVMKQMKKLGSLSKILGMIPGMPKISQEQMDFIQTELRNYEIIINSMTPQERKKPEIIKASRKSRIVKGCGLSNQEINRLLNRYDAMKKQLPQMKGIMQMGQMAKMFNQNPSGR